MSTDPVAAKSSFLCMYMSNHPDTLVSYVRHWGKVNAGVTTAKMTAIDTKGMNLTYTTKSSKETKEVRVVFDPPLSGYEEVKPRLLNMKADAEEALGMVPAPQISTFDLTPRVLQTAAMIGTLVFVTFAPGPLSPSYSPVFALGHTIRAALPAGMLKGCWIMMVTIHALECLYTYSLCKRHRTGFIVGLQYVVATFLFGYPVWTDMRRRVQAARIESIMKGQ